MSAAGWPSRSKIYSIYIDWTECLDLFFQNSVPPKQEPIDPDMIRQHPDTAAASTTATLNDDLGSPLDDVGALETTIEKIMCTTYFTPAFVIVFEKN